MDGGDVLSLNGNRKLDYVEGNRLGQNAEAEAEGDQRRIDRRATAAHGAPRGRLVVMRALFRRLTMLVQRAHLPRLHAFAAGILFDRCL